MSLISPNLMLRRSFFPIFGQGPFPKIAGKSPGLCNQLGARSGEHSGSVVECMTLDGGDAGLSLSMSLCCVLEQDTFILA